MSDTPQKTPNETTDNPQASVPDTPQGQQQAATSEATFTQADMDTLAGKIRKEARETTMKSILEELGVDSLENVKSTFEAEQKRKEAELSEVEKAQAEIEKANKKAQAAETKLQEMQAQILERDRKQAFLKAVQDNGGNQVDDLFILVNAKYGDDFKAVFDDDAQADAKKMDSFIKQVQSSFPNYFGTSGAGSPSNSQGVPPNSHNSEEVKSIIKKKFGKL